MHANCAAYQILQYQSVKIIKEEFKNYIHIQDVTGGTDQTSG